MEDKKKNNTEEHICHCGHGGHNGAHQCHHEDVASDKDHGHKHTSEDDSCECCQ